MKDDLPQVSTDGSHQLDETSNNLLTPSPPLLNSSSNDNVMDTIEMMMNPESYKDSTSIMGQSLNDLLTSQLSQTTGQLNSSTGLTDSQGQSLQYNTLSFVNNSINTSPFSISSLLSNGDSNSPTKPHIIPKSSIPHNTLLNFSLPSTHMEYLRLFYDDYSKVIMPFCPLDRTEDAPIFSGTGSSQGPSPVSSLSASPSSAIAGFTASTTKNLGEAIVASIVPAAVTTTVAPALATGSSIPTIAASTSNNKHSDPQIIETSLINPARDIILYYAHKESYVLAAVLACGALTAYRHSKSLADEEKYCSYLSTCMSLLGQSLNDEATSDKRQKGKMEGMIITTLLLTSYNASSNVVKWRPHLETAGRLLMHSAYYHNNDNTDTIEFGKVERETLAFCRSWFFSIEIIAGMSSNWGGTMNDRDWKIMELWIEEDSDLLRRMRINWKNPNVENEGVDDFNLMLGYSDKLAIVLGRLCCVLRRARLGEKLKLSEISWFLTQLECKEIKKYYLLSHTGYLNKDFQHKPGLGIPKEAVEKFDDIDLNGDIVYVSWWDICYQAHRMSGIIHTLTKLFMLDRNHFLVMNAIEETVNLLRFLRTKKKIKSYALMMFQFCVFLVGKWTTEIEHRSLVSKYFRDLHDFGTIAARYSMKKLERLWRNEDGDQEEEDIINY
ncbi:hypothetical protein PMKS-000064 [Pichia membranifaciens]|uniref:Transcription factor domain-containing protein n=1 Tax=Pichia membranifaciens TaxID=4926 RepID=A0A1Q2YAQ1_9ASCO|nr:hypothetical protein PMKS-000064 [Pichia membranifaciens]